MHDALAIGDPHVIFGWHPLWVATALLIITYGAIITEKFNRAIIALLGAGLMIISGVLNQHAAVAGIDFNTLALLTGMMVLVAITGKCGIFEYVAIWATKLVNANPPGILLVMALVTAVFSALLDNVTTVLLIAPVTLLITEALKISAYPFLFTIIIASNIGGTATLIGDPPNILIGSAAGLSFNDFVINLAPIASVLFVIVIGGIYLFWGRKLKTTDALRNRVMNFDEREAVKDIKLLKQSLAVIALVLLSFMFGHGFGLEPGTIAMFGAALLLLLHNVGKSAEEQTDTVHHFFGEVEWITIFFFVGLFIVVAGVEHAGLLNILALKLVELTQGDLPITASTILWVSAIVSTLLDNIPFVATMIPVIESLAPEFGGSDGLTPLWWSLALGACLGGNGSLIGASANLTVAAFAEKAKQPIAFLPFMKLAFPIMLVTIAIANIYLYLRYL
jgi:Na+/H+ antiporter NhaD/arsenite permease-like protein